MQPWPGMNQVFIDLADKIDLNTFLARVLSVDYQ
jgi:hypothetical protein